MTFFFCVSSKRMPETESKTVLRWNCTLTLIFLFRPVFRKRADICGVRNRHMGTLGWETCSNRATRTASQNRTLCSCCPLTGSIGCQSNPRVSGNRFCGEETRQAPHHIVLLLVFNCSWFEITVRTTRYFGTLKENEGKMNRENKSLTYTDAFFFKFMESVILIVWSLRHFMCVWVCARVWHARILEMCVWIRKCVSEWEKAACHRPQKQLLLSVFKFITF